MQFVIFITFFILVFSERFHSGTVDKLVAAEPKSKKVLDTKHGL
jgi:hypothetical protein